MGCGQSSGAEASEPSPESVSTSPKPEASGGGGGGARSREVSSKEEAPLELAAIKPSVSDELGGDGEDTNDPDARLCKFACGKRVQPGTTRSGKPFDTCCRLCALNKGIGLHDHTCGGKKGEPSSRLACKDGAKCRRRTPEHLKEEAHPLDEDYAAACAKTSGVEAAPMTLRVLFDWTDADGSGKLSREELETALVDIEKVFPGVLPKMEEAAWKRLDEDGNGVVNFGEFAAWAGPRLGLPLGMRKTIAKTSSMTMACPCTVLGCPCESLEEEKTMKLTGSVTRCKVCKHKASVHQHPITDAEVPSPPYWEHQSGVFNHRVELPGQEADFQTLLTKTYKSSFTRDRKAHNPTCWKVPSGFKVVAVKRNENSESWKEYGCRRAEVIERYKGDKDVVQFETKVTAAMKDAWGKKADRLDPTVNEWYLFHGTNPVAAASIAEGDFKVSRAGSNTGTLYGKGLYFAESITKADEYAKPDEHGRYAALLCRVLGGKVRYTAELEPDPEDLVNSVIEGPYDCVLGDREQTRNTYREFVLFDSEDVYVEYIILYTRNYA